MQNKNMNLILEGLVSERAKMHLSDLILLRANYNKDLHDAIMKGNQKFVDKFYAEYKENDTDGELDAYDDEKLVVKDLKKKLIEQDKEYADAHRKGQHIFGESIEKDDDYYAQFEEDDKLKNKHCDIWLDDAKKCIRAEEKEGSKRKLVTSGGKNKLYNMWHDVVIAWSDKMTVDDVKKITSKYGYTVLE